MATLVREKLDSSLSDQCLDAGVSISQEFLQQADAVSLSGNCSSIPLLSEVLNFFVTSEIGLAYSSPEAIGSAPAHIQRLCEYKLLSPEMERTYFEQLAYCLYYGRELVGQSGMERELESLSSQYMTLLEVLTRSNTRMILSIIKPFVRQGWDFDELLSLGTESLLESVHKFDVFLGYRFSTYFHTVFKRRVYRYMDTEKTRNQRYVRYEHFDSCEQEGSSRVASPDLVCGAIDSLLSLLDDRESYIIERRFGINRQDKLSLKQLADQMEISKERVRQLEQRALKKLSKQAASMNLQDDMMFALA